MDETRLNQSTVRIISATGSEEIVRLLADTLRSVAGIESVAIFLNQEGFFRAILPETSPGLFPGIEAIEAAFRAPIPISIQQPGIGKVTLIPLANRGEKLGIAVLAAPLKDNEVIKLRYLVDHASAALHTARVLSVQREQFALLSNLLESISNGIITLDRNGIVTLANRFACGLLGMSLPPIGKPHYQALPAELLEPIDLMKKELQAGQFPMERQIIHRMPDGGETPIAVSLSLLRDSREFESGVIIVLRDMSAGKELDRLRKIDEMKDRFVANVSHELKTPLTSIKAYTEAVKDMATTDQMKQFLGVIDEEADRLLAMINDLLNVSRIRSGTIRMDFESVSPKTLIEEVMRIQPPTPKHKLVTEFVGDLPAMLMDRDKMKEVLINLISNAVKYSPNGGTVWVRARRVDDSCQFEVQDQGVGIPKEHQARLFQTFYRINDAATTGVSGTGLGLAIVSAIMDQHGGRIWVGSEPGKGSTFHAAIPIRKRETGRHESPKPKS